MTLFHIDEEYGGWKCSRNDGRLDTHLAVNFYHSKETLLAVLELLEETKAAFFIETFIMPYDYPKDKLKFIIEHDSVFESHTNGTNFGVSNFWIERGAGINNIPLDLLFKNPFITDDDIFNLLVEKACRHPEIFAIHLYNKNLTEAQIAELGSEVVKYSKSHSKLYEYEARFIGNNLKFFKDEDVEYLLKLATFDYDGSTFYYSNYPEKYQKKLLMQKDLESLLTTLIRSKFSAEQKQEILTEYLNRKN